jgi:tagatose 1,6-diphosphate aldolase GatY/KbaY
MRFLPMSDLLGPARGAGFAVPAFCVWNAETVDTVLRVAAEMESPVVLMHGPGEHALLGPRTFANVARSIASDFDVPCALHLDHGDSMDQVAACLDAGFTSVMLDYSARPYAENVSALRQVVAAAKPRGVSVEGELGHVGRADEEGPEGRGCSTLTEPEEAAAFVSATGIDALAVSIGNAHGQYTRLPRLDFDRLSRISAAVRVPLVLHGGSGTPVGDLRRAISLGIAKVNVATEVVAAVRTSLADQWAAGRGAWVPLATAEAMAAAGRVVRRWIEATGAAGQAGRCR